VTDLLAGQIDLMFAPAPTVMPHAEAGKLRVIAVTSARRSATLPQVPTVAESGLPGYDAIGWFGLLAPAATPTAIVERLSQDVNTVLAKADVKQRMLLLGVEPSGNTPEQFARFIRDDLAKWAKLMRERGIAPE
jgi:tripartite-type tricarboxylate transporter receptor subunit TctC